jgi:origin recognition complex subunit 4
MPLAIQIDSSYGSKEDSLVVGEESHAITGGEDVIESKKMEFEPQRRLLVIEIPRRSGNTSTKARIKNHVDSTVNAQVPESLISSPRGTRSTRSKSGAEVGNKTETGKRRESSMNTPIKSNLGTTKRTYQKQQFLVKNVSVKSPGIKSRPLNRPATDEDDQNQRAKVDSSDAAEIHETREQDDSDQEQTRNDGDTITLHSRTSGRERRPPRRFSSTLAKADKPRVELPKGILTPSRKEKKAPRKFVVFDKQENEIDDALGFKDIELSTEKSKNEQRKDMDEDICDAARLEEDILVVEADEPLFEDGLLPDLASVTELPEELNIGEASADESLVEDHNITTIKSTILSRLSLRSHATPNLLHLQTQFTTLHTLLTSTIAAGESNSLLLLGSRGSGKSLLVNTALADLTRKHTDDFHIVRLNGFIQTDDKLALREIWRQLGREMKVDDDDTNEVISYAETMTSLLGLLAHPEELHDPNVMNLDESADARIAKSVIFILDEFDLFTTHPRQTLLYNLFDIAQARKAPIAVIGCSTRMDVVDCLEKRVKSRFSHRWLHVPSARSISGWEEVVAETLCIVGLEERTTLIFSGKSKVTTEQKECESRWNHYIKVSCYCILPCPLNDSLLTPTNRPLSYPLQQSSLS